MIHITQILPADGWWALYADWGQHGEVQVWEEPLACFALVAITDAQGRLCGTRVRGMTASGVVRDEFADADITFVEYRAPDEERLTVAATEITEQPTAAGAIARAKARLEHLREAVEDDAPPAEDDDPGDLIPDPPAPLLRGPAIPALPTTLVKMDSQAGNA